MLKKIHKTIDCIRMSECMEKECQSACLKSEKLKTHKNFPNIIQKWNTKEAFLRKKKKYIIYGSTKLIWKRKQILKKQVLYT